MKKQILFPILVLIAFAGVPGLLPAQDQLTLKWSPLGLIDPNRGQVLLGAEFRPWPVLSLEVSYGIRLSQTELLGWNNTKQDRRYENLRLEIRTYPIEEVPVYWGLEGFRIWETYRLEEGIYWGGGSGPFTFDRADVSRQIWGVCPKIGFLIPLSKRLRLDMYGGLGLRSRTYTIVAENPLLQDEGFGGPENYNPLIAGTTRRPHIAAGFRLGYMILKKK
ncbi:MAG: hypothetical protein SF053_09890 [Bacteroidia bacterium]|nr:hypothetical protein [Bacteroidia bacterium]